MKVLIEAHTSNLISGYKFDSTTNPGVVDKKRTKEKTVISQAIWKKGVIWMTTKFNVGLVSRSKDVEPKHVRVGVK